MVNMNVDVFKANFDGGSRANRFAVTGQIGGLNPASINNIVVKAGSMPAVTVGILRVPFRGRVVKMPGDRTYEEWTFTVMDGFDDNSNFRDKFLKWNEIFNQHQSNTPGTPFSTGSGIDMNHANLFTDWNVHQLGLQGHAVRSVTLHKCWPTVVGEVALSYESSDTISEYTVTLAYDYLTDHGTWDTPESAGTIK